MCNAEPVESSVWEFNQSAKAYRIGDNATTFLVPGTLRSQPIVRRYVTKCFRDSGFPTADYALHLEMSERSMEPTSHTLKLGIRIDDINTTPTVQAIMKQFRMTIPSFADARIERIDLLLQGLSSMPIVPEIVPQARPSLHLFVALWKQTSLSFATDHVDGNDATMKALTRPTMEVADFIITDFGRARVFNFLGGDCSTARLYSGTLWIQLTVPETGVRLTPIIPSNVQQRHPFEVPFCGRCGQCLSSDTSKIERHCPTCHGQPRICGSCYELRPKASMIDAYVMEMEACTDVHPLAGKVKAFLIDGFMPVRCICDCSSWS